MSVDVAWKTGFVDGVSQDRIESFLKKAGRAEELLKPLMSKAVEYHVDDIEDATAEEQEYIYTCVNDVETFVGGLFPDEKAQVTKAIAFVLAGFKPSEILGESGQEDLATALGFLNTPAGAVERLALDVAGMTRFANGQMSRLKDAAGERLFSRSVVGAVRSWIRKYSRKAIRLEAGLSPEMFARYVAAESGQVIEPVRNKKSGFLTFRLSAGDAGKTLTPIERLTKWADLNGGEVAASPNPSVVFVTGLDTAKTMEDAVSFATNKLGLKAAIVDGAGLQQVRVDLA